MPFDYIDAAVRFFREEIAPNHLANIEKLDLSEFQLNPFLDKYKGNMLRGEITPRSIAEGLVYPRVLGTSLNTTFGNKAQKFVATVLGPVGSGIDGMDLEFIDRVSGVKMYCQVKAGPNTINADDVRPILDKFTKARRLLSTNHESTYPEQFIIGVLYGDPRDLSGHYRRIKETHPVYIGQEFWYRVTGEIDFYDRLTDAIGAEAVSFDGAAAIERAVARVARDIKSHPGFYFET